MSFSSKESTTFLNKLDKESINKYRNYWKNLIPKTHLDYWKRWVFSFMSVHTTWKQNVKGYEAVVSLGMDFNRRQLRRRIESSRVGLNRIRTEGILRMTKSFISDPRSWYPGENESFRDCRDRLMNETFGLGITKVSFVLELLDSEKCDAVCLDTHLLQLYKLPRSTPNKTLYKDVENHWIDICKSRKIPSPLARHIFWDRKQGKSLNNYWAYVFEAA